MAPYPNWLRNSLLAGWALALPALAMVVPAGTQLQVRLKTKIASNTSKPDDPVETMVIAPVTVNGRRPYRQASRCAAWSREPARPPIRRCARRLRWISGSSKWAAGAFACKH